MYGLTSQFRRAAVSISANIAEGFTKKSDLDKIRFFNIAQGSLNECHYYLILSRDLNYCKNANLFDLANEIGKLLNSYINAIKNSNSYLLNSIYLQKKSPRLTGNFSLWLTANLR